MELMQATLGLITGCLDWGSQFEDWLSGITMVLSGDSKTARNKEEILGQL